MFIKKLSNVFYDKKLGCEVQTIFFSRSTRHSGEDVKIY